jgi:uncharacterized membrane protein YcaP (DUF421 family)
VLFDSWTSLGRTALAGAVAYAALVLILRVSGKRTLAKMNAFDLVVTVALGSTLSSVLVSRSVPLADGLLALLLLVALQFVVAWTAIRVPGFENLVKSAPTLLVYHGTLQSRAMRRQRVSGEEVLAAARSAGHPNLATVAALVLETDGSFSVIPHRTPDQPLAGRLRAQERDGTDAGSQRTDAQRPHAESSASTSP